MAITLHDILLLKGATLQYLILTLKCTPDDKKCIHDNYTWNEIQVKLVNYEHVLEKTKV